MRRTVMAVLAVLAGIVVMATAAWAGADDQDCGDFPNREAAQAHYDQNRADPDQLDPDKDGQACETFNYSAPAPPSTSPIDTVVPTTARTAVPTTTARTPTTRAPTPTTAPRTQATTATTAPMATTGPVTDRLSLAATAALAFGVFLVMVGYTRTRSDRRML